MMHCSQVTYLLSHFRQRTSKHLKRLSEGRVETITQNGEAAMVVMSHETYDGMHMVMEHGHLWDEAIANMGEGKGRDAREAFQEVAKG